MSASLWTALAQFFAKGELVEMTPELKRLFKNGVSLSPEQKEAAQRMLEVMNKK